MSPEGAAIFVFDAGSVGPDGLNGTLTTYDEAPPAPLSWDWDDPKSQAYEPQLGGLFYLRSNVQASVSDKAGRFDRVGGNRHRYQFTASKLVPGHLPIALIVLLPHGWTLAKPPPEPRLTRAKVFNGRLAAFWRLEGEGFRAESVDFSIAKGKPNMALVNRRFRHIKATDGRLAFLRSPAFWAGVSAVAALVGAIVGFLAWVTQSAN